MSSVDPRGMETGMEKHGSSLGEPWMRGTHGDLDPLRRGVVHALEQGLEDADRWCASLESSEMFARPGGLPPVAFHMRHVARSLDRLLTYAEDRALDEEQHTMLGTEMDGGTVTEVLAEFRKGMEDAVRRVQAFTPESYNDVRGIGRRRLPTTVGGLLVHCAEHTLRHIGQMVTTAKLVRGLTAELRVRSEETADRLRG